MRPLTILLNLCFSSNYSLFKNYSKHSKLLYAHVLTFLTSLFIIFLILIKLSIFLTNSIFYFSRHNFSSSSSTKLILTMYPEGIPLSSDIAIILSHMPCYHCWLTTRTTSYSSLWSPCLSLCTKQSNIC